MRVGIEKRGDDPAEGCPVVLLDGTDYAIPDNDVGSAFPEIAPKESNTAQEALMLHGNFRTVLYTQAMKYIHMTKKRSGRLLSSAGLVNYYDSEDRRAVQVSPYAVLIAAAAIGIFIAVMNLVF
jgi:preprotein translocase subunit Sec61beta